MKFNCQDPLVKLLAQYGYSLVLLPRENIAPLQVLSREGNKFWFGIKDFLTTPILDDTHATLGELFLADSQAMPAKRKGDVVNDLRAKRSSELSVEAAAALMTELLALPEEDKSEAQQLKIQAALKSAKALSFTFGDDAFEESVSLIGLDAFVSDSVIKTHVGATFREKIEKGQIYIITSVLKATSFTIEGSREQEGSASINVPKIKEILEGKVEGSFEVFEQSGLKYKGDKALVFGFKAARLKTLTKEDKMIFKLTTQHGRALKDDEDPEVEYLGQVGEEVFLDLG